MEQETANHATTLDALIQDRQLQMMKAAIPYINNSNQKTMAFLIKFLELQRTIHIFDSPNASMQICSVQEDEEPLPLQMLNALREFCTEKEQETLDLLMNYLQMFSAYETLFT